jgi:hypothetical protein
MGLIYVMGLLQSGVATGKSDMTVISLDKTAVNSLGNKSQEVFQRKEHWL